MSAFADTPFFPVPVRWFEIPMNTARWGFVPVDESAAVQVGASHPLGSLQSLSTAAVVEPPHAKAPEVGQLLNERA